MALFGREAGRRHRCSAAETLCQCGRRSVGRRLGLDASSEASSARQRRQWPARPERPRPRVRAARLPRAPASSEACTISRHCVDRCPRSLSAVARATSSAPASDRTVSSDSRARPDLDIVGFDLGVSLVDGVLGLLKRRAQLFERADVLVELRQGRRRSPSRATRATPASARARRAGTRRARRARSPSPRAAALRPTARRSRSVSRA